MAAGLAEINAKLEAENRSLGEIKDLLQEMLNNDIAEANAAKRDRKKALEDRIEAKNRSRNRGSISGAFFSGLLGDTGVAAANSTMGFFGRMQDALLGGIGTAGLLASKGVGRGLKFGALAVGVNALAQEVIDNAFENMTFDDNLSEEEKKNIKDKASTAINTGFMLKFLGLPGWATLGGAVGTAFGNDIQAQMMTYFDTNKDGKLEVAGFDLGEQKYAEAIGGAAGILAMGIINFVGKKFALLAAGAGLAALLAEAGYNELAALIRPATKSAGKKIAALSTFRELELKAGTEFREQQKFRAASLGLDVEYDADEATKKARKEAAEKAAREAAEASARIAAVKSGLSQYRPMKVGSAPITGGSIADDALKGLRINTTGGEVTGYMQDGKFIKKDVAVKRLATAGLSPLGTPIAPTISTTSIKPKLNIKSKVRGLKGRITAYVIQKMPLVLGKAIPILGVGAGLAMSAWNAIRGDYTSASLNAGATFVGVVPVIGGAAGLSADLASIPTMVFFDFSPQFFNLPEGVKGITFNPNDPDHVEAMKEISIIVSEAIEEYLTKSRQEAKNVNVLSAEAYAGFAAQGAAYAERYNASTVVDTTASNRGTDTRLIRSRNFGADIGIGGKQYGTTGIGIQESFVPGVTSEELRAMKSVANSFNNGSNNTVVVEAPKTTYNSGGNTNQAINFEESGALDLADQRREQALFN